MKVGGIVCGLMGLYVSETVSIQMRGINLSQGGGMKGGRDKWGWVKGGIKEIKKVLLYRFQKKVFSKGYSSADLIGPNTDKDRSYCGSAYRFTLDPHVHRHLCMQPAK